MTKILVGFLILFVCQTLTAQFIALTPTNYSLTILIQNNVGRIWSDWQTSASDDIVVGARILTYKHTAYFDRTMFAGSRVGGPKMLEDTYRYRQVGAASYKAIGGEQIVFFAPRANGNGWIAGTNIVLAADMETWVYWLPSFVGTVTTGDRYSHTVTTGSSLQMWGRNIGSGPYMLRVPCTGLGGIGFSFFYPFAKGERKLLTLGVNQVQGIFAQQQIFNASVHWFMFSLDNLPEETPL